MPSRAVRNMASAALAVANKSHANAVAARTAALSGVNAADLALAVHTSGGVIKASQQMVECAANSLLLAFMHGTDFEVRIGNKVRTVRFLKTNVVNPVNIWTWKCSARAMNLRRAPIHNWAVIKSNDHGKSVVFKVPDFGDVKFDVPLLADGSPDVDGEVSVSSFASKDE